jgi:hypothetical protein
MNKAALVFLAGMLMAWNAAAQTQSGAQASASAQSQTSAEAGKTGAQASSSTSAAGSASAQAGQNSVNVASGTTMNAQLTRPVDAKKNKPGDSVTAKTTENVKSDGQVVIPKGSKLVGHVTQAKARAKGESESALGIVFDRAILKNGQEVPLNVAIQALAATESAAAASLGGDDLSMASSAGGGAGASGRAAGGGLVGGVASTAGGAVGAVTNTAANVGGAAGGTVNSTLNAAGAASGAVGGLNAAGQFASNSRGVFGLEGLNLNAAASNSTQGSVITSTSKNVHLDSGTRMLLVAQGEAQSQGQQAAKPQPKAAEREPAERERPQSKPPVE